MTTSTPVLALKPPYLQQGRFSRDSVTEVTSETVPQMETVYELNHLPDGFVAVFDHGVFHTDNVRKLSAGVKEKYKGKKIKLVPFSELEGKAYTYDNVNHKKIASLNTNNLYILLVQDDNIPKNDLAKAMYLARQAIKDTRKKY